ncbi:Hypothetical protein MCYN_0082 [Mycoplasmopsis cynos C142]|uniref:Uncharacterized protein n=1 Tax=Mycoplasmopsis cynos (strain C142) TaxID=1246955 RepID=L0RUA2_MYCC1|nr:Hypothetical protein MCYN_0082 [Mycoplasmopsis cynos C142]
MSHKYSPFKYVKKSLGSVRMIFPSLTCFGFYYFLKIHSKICFLKLVSFPNVRKLGLINEKLLKKLLGLLNDLNPSYPWYLPLPELPTPPKGK